MRQSVARLLGACALSLMLHAALLGVPVHGPGSAASRASAIEARLAPAVDREPLRETVAIAKTDTPARQHPEHESPVATAKPQVELQQPVAAPPSAPAIGVELPAHRDPTYYPARQLDIYPQPLAPIRLTYPDGAAGERVGGRLVLWLMIDEFGAVDDATVVQAEPASLFEADALATLRAVRFAPAQKRGLPVKSRVLLEVNYGAHEGAAR